MVLPNSTIIGVFMRHFVGRESSPSTSMQVAMVMACLIALPVLHDTCKVDHGKVAESLLAESPLATHSYHTHTPTHPHIASFPGLHAQLLSHAVRKAGEGLDGFIT